MTARRTIPRTPVLPPAMDWAGLRALGLAEVQRLSGTIWTDHNAHDPGITTLELLAYALTDLAYRMNLPTVDLLTRTDDRMDPPARSGLQPAHEVLTTAPRTVADYRRLLMRIEGVRNAWMDPLPPGDGEVPVFADCLMGALSLASQNAAAAPNHPVPVSGLWRVMADLDPDDRLGAMNETGLTYRVLSGVLKGAVLRFDCLDAGFLAGAIDFRPGLASFSIGAVAQGPSGFSLPVTVTLTGAAAHVLQPCLVQVIKDRPRTDQPALDITVAAVTGVLNDATPEGLIHSFFEKQQRRAAAVARIATALHAHRGLCEDFLSVSLVDPFPIGVCADIEVAAGADLEAVQAAVYHAVESYLAPPVRFHTLDELLAQGVPVETIFDGPYIDFTLTAAGMSLFTKPGFVTDADLDASELRREIHASDLINLFHDIAGVEAVRNLQLQDYSLGVAKVPAQSWTLAVPAAHQPVFLTEVSKLLFFRAGIPYRARPEEFAATLADLRARERRDVYVPPDQVLPAPQGRWRHLDAFYPLQHDFPATYKIGAAGIARSETPERIARARQFKGYLCFFEQVLGDYLGQLAGLRQLYSLDPGLERSWFSLQLTGVAGSLDLFEDEFLTRPAIYANPTARARLTETEDEFLERRNRLLDHLIARFAERFADYSLMQFRLSGDRARTSQELIADKIDFLGVYPVLSRGRGQGANIRPENAALVWDSDNISGLERRAGRLVGIDDLTRRDLHCRAHFALLMGAESVGQDFCVVIKAADGTALFRSREVFTEAAALTAAQDAYAGLRGEGAMVVGVRQGTTTFELNIVSGAVALTSQDSFDTAIDATRAARAIIDAYDVALASDPCKSEGLHLIEHILLRPRAGDHAVMDVCLAEDCEFCGEEDPYSFRVSVVLPYWPERCRNLEFRAMVERTLREEAPAHVQVKICWIGQRQTAELDQAHHDWLTALRQGDAATIRGPAKALIDLLARLRTVYPAATLHDCDDGDAATAVRLGATALGIF